MFVARSLMRRPIFARSIFNHNTPYRVAVTLTAVRRADSIPRMKLLGILSGLLGLGACLLAAQAVDETKPYGLACVTVIDAKANKESVLGGDIQQSAGRQLTVHLDANSQGEVLLVALTKKESRLAHGWRPVLLPLKEWSEFTAPPATGKWIFTDATEAFEVFVVFIAKDAPGIESMRKLVAQLGAPGAEAATLKTQSRLLREELQKWQSAAGALAHAPAASPTGIGGTVRAPGEFPWRTLARKANFSAAQPAIIVFRSAAAN